MRVKHISWYGGIIRPQAELMIRHLDAEGNLMYRRKRGLLGRLREGIEPDVQVAHGTVTDAYVAFLVDQHQAESSAIGDFKYHDSGTGVVAENAADTGLGTATGVARATGTQIEGATANIYKSVATITYDDTYAITEHGLFNTSDGATLMDRTKFGVVNVVVNEKIEFTYQLTLPSGG